MTATNDNQEAAWISLLYKQHSLFSLLKVLCIVRGREILKNIIKISGCWWGNQYRGRACAFLFSQLRQVLGSQSCTYRCKFWSWQQSNLVIPRVKDLSTPKPVIFGIYESSNGVLPRLALFQMLPPPYPRGTGCRTDGLSVCLESQGSTLCIPGLACHCCFHSDSVLTFR